MLVSKRRLRWSAITLLILCLLLLCRPTRNWIDRMFVAQFIGSEVSIGEILVHRSRSILEARDLGWNRERGNRKIQFSARRGWFAYDNIGLIDRHPRLPKVVFQDVNLRLDGASPTSTQLDVWKHRLAQQITQLDWERLGRQFASLTAAQELKKTWSDNIERWVARSQQILAEAEELERQTADLDNPLRFEFTIQEKLERLQELSGEQGLLSEQMDALDQQVAAEAIRLQELQHQDQMKLVGLVIGNVAVHDQMLERQQIGSELTEALGQAFWRQIAAFGEVIDQLAQATREQQQRPSYDVNIRSSRNGNEWLQLTQWKASGEFIHDKQPSLFTASGSWSLTQEPLLPSSLDFDWRATFMRDRMQVDVRAQHDSRQSDSIQLDVMVHRGELGAELPGDRPSMTGRGEESIRGVRVSLMSQAGQLSGELEVPAVALGWLESATVAPLLAGASQPDAEPLLFQLSGQWTKVELDVGGASPAWLTQTIASEAERLNQVAAESSKQQLEQAFTTELLELQQLVQTALSHSKPLTANHARLLLATQDRLQRQLADRNDAEEFARRPAAAITR